MSSRLEDRLRQLMRERRVRDAETLLTTETADAGARQPRAQPVPAGSRRSSFNNGAQAPLLDAAAETLGGDVLHTPHGVVVCVDRFYPLDHTHGLIRLGGLGGTTLAAAPELALLGTTPEPPGHEARPLLFVDLETTGLAGGAGTYAFLVGCARFERHGFRIQQYFLPGAQHERPQLAAVELLVRGASSLVSYNGRSFDVPVLETRYLFNRLSPPFEGVGHLDMLHPARRFWRGAPAAPGAWPDSDSCRLTALERTLFGVRRVGDVPGFEIPARYFQFVRTGDASPLEPVFEHNRLDLLSLACLTERALRLLADAPTSSRSARESCGAGRLLERAGKLEAAESCYRDAAARARIERGPDASATRAEALRNLALLCRRGHRFEEAAQAWSDVVANRGTPASARREALEALAIHYEHRRRDLNEARRYAQLSLAARASTRSMADGRHRLARLDRKLWKKSTGPEGSGPLLPQF
jgi:uncharacterized protein